MWKNYTMIELSNNFIFVTTTFQTCEMYYLIELGEVVWIDLHFIFSLILPSHF